MNCVALALLAFVAGAAAQQRTGFYVFEWEGCPFCARFNSILWTDGWQKGLGDIAHIDVYWSAGHHDGFPYVKGFHEYVACSEYAHQQYNESDSDHYWFGVVDCMDNGIDYNQCEDQVGMPQEVRGYIHSCMNNTDLSQGIVNYMESIYNKYSPGYTPAVYIGNTEVENDANALIKRLCGMWTGSSKPECCSLTSVLEAKADPAARTTIKRV